MNPNEWTPDPALLAAYLDGKLSGRDELQAKVQAWVARQPEDAGALAALLADTRAREPGSRAWAQVLQRIQAKMHRRPARGKPLSFRRLLYAAAVVLIAVLGYPLVAPSRRPPPLAAVDRTPLAVANSEEVRVLRIDGEDTLAVLRATLPVDGPLDLAAAGEVELTSVEPDARTQVVLQVRMARTDRPMVWAKLETEEP